VGEVVQGIKKRLNDLGVADLICRSLSKEEQV
jgi:hypothetical protein